MKEVVSRSHYQLQGIHYALKPQSLLYHTSLDSLELIVVCGNLAMDGSKSIVMVQLRTVYGGRAACDGIVGNSDGSLNFLFSSNLDASSIVLEEL